MNKNDLETQYRQITDLYDMAEELAATVDSEFVKDKEAQIQLIEPLIAQTAETADVLSEEYVSLFEVPSRKSSAKGKVESTLRKLFLAFEEYRKSLGLRSKSVTAALLNIADPVVEKLRKHVEKITLMFMQLMDLSLERIMHKYEVDEFRRANEKAISGLMPQLGL